MNVIMGLKYKILMFSFSACQLEYKLNIKKKQAVPFFIFSFPYRPPLVKTERKNLTLFSFLRHLRLLVHEVGIIL